jgi:tetratricopeptide (TPR) repeat protein
MGSEVLFVGRTDELARLAGWADEVAETGIGRFVLVTGEAGTGKTHLCAEFERRWRARGLESVWARCWDAGGGPPMWPWPDLLRELDESGGGAASDVTAAAAGERFDLFRSVLDQLRAHCSGGRFVIVLDDLHVANEDVVMLTRFIGRGLHHVPVLLVATWRLERAAGSEALARLASIAREATVLELGPFGESEIAEYLECCGRSDLKSDLAGLSAISGGNPMLLVELVRQGPAETGRAGGHALTSAVERRIRHLGERDRTLIAAGAVLGDGVRMDEIAAIVGCSVDELVDAAGRSGGAAEVIDGRLRFSHALLRDAFGRSLPVSDRLGLHLAAMEAVPGAHPEQLVWRAHHAVRAASISSAHKAVAAAACQAAAVSLHRCLAFEQAADWAATGCGLASGVVRADVEAELLLVHAGAVLASGRLAKARKLFDRAADVAERAQNARCLAAAALGLGGVWVEELRDELSRRRLLGLCRRALLALPDDEPMMAARLEVRLAAELAYDGGAVADVRHRVQTVRQHGDPAATAEALSLLHHTLLGPEHAVERLQVADELLELALSAGGTIYPLFGLCWKTVDLYLIGSVDADRSLVELRDRAAAVGCRSIGYIVAVIDVMRTIRRGELERAEAIAAEALAFGETVGDADSLAYYAAHLLVIRWLQGRLPEMSDAVASVIESSTLRRRDVSYTAVWALVCAVRGDVRAARTAIDAVTVDGLASIGVPSNRLTTWAILAEAAAEVGDAPLAHQLAMTMAPFAELPVMPSLAIACLGPAARAIGVACATYERREEAIGWFRKALIANQRLGNGPIEAMIRADLADLLRHGSAADRSEAVSLYASAVSLGTRFGMSGRVAGWAESAASLDSPAVVKARRGTFEQRQSAWLIDIDGRSTTVDHVIGLRYLADLLARPDTDVPAVELAGGVYGNRVIDTVPGEQLVDDRARREYELRIRQLDSELDTADVLGDAERGRRAAEERELLIDHLRREFGLAHRPRRQPDEAERCRTRVSKAIHRAIQRVYDADPVLGRGLVTGVQTGYTCRYTTDPGDPVVWTVKTGAATS